ncbi:MAG: endonuclease/exonuclease/phosphatase family protein [Planctomycetota bacterium]
MKNARSMFLPALCAGAAVSLFAPLAAAQIRVVTWNISNYAGGREVDLKNAIYSSFEGRVMSPDVFVTQEFLSDSARAAFQTILNTQPGGPTDWLSAPFIDGPDTDSAFFYRSSKITYIATTIAAVGGGSTSNQPRHTYRYDWRPVGYAAPSTTVAWYAVHLKAGSASADQTRRQLEASRIDADARNNVLSQGWQAVVAGDFNIQTSNQTAYQTLAGPGAVFADPIGTPGSWNNNSTFHVVHTQDPAGAGGMDDRHDQILMSPSFASSLGLRYVGTFGQAYSTSVWNDPNHTYRAFGNDGTSFDGTLVTTGNTMVGSSIAVSLINICAGAGHLPIIADLSLPPKIAADATISFGQVALNSPQSRSFIVMNAGDTARFGASAIRTLTYSLAASAGFSAPAGGFNDGAGGGTNAHLVTMDTSSPGVKAGTITIASNAPDSPSIVINITGEVLAPSCPADFDGDGTVDFFDYDTFVNCFEGVVCPPGKTADFDADGTVDFFDYDAFVVAFETPCP